jgi:hypothetical protein
VVLAGALGKISLNSIRKPKQSISIQPPGGHHAASSDGQSLYNRIAGTKTIEGLYSELYALEDIFADRGPGDLRTEEEKAGNARPHLRAIAPYLGADLSMYRSKKGISWMGRAVSFLVQERTDLLPSVLDWVNTLVTEILPSFCGQDGWDSEMEEAFIRSVLGALIPVLGTASWSSVLEWSRLLVSSDFFLKKPYYVFFCILLSRVELLKTEQGDAASLEALRHLAMELHKGALYGHYGALFTASDGSPERDYYAWQFLSLLAAHLDSTSCHAMVAELRDEIIVAANSPHPGAVANVNLLLHVLGLDAQQLRQAQ